MWFAAAGTTAAGLSGLEIAGPLAEDTAVRGTEPQMAVLSPLLTIASLFIFGVKKVSLSSLRGHPSPKRRN